MIRISGRLVALIIVVIAILVIAMTSFFSVDQSETGIVLRFGRFNRAVPAGLQWKWPLGIEESIVVPTQQRLKMEFGYRTEEAGAQTRYSSIDYSRESRMLTGDLNIADVEWEIQYEISDPRAWLFNFVDPVQTLRDISRSVMNRLIGDRAILDVLGSERENIQVQAQVLMNQYLQDLELGVNITTVRAQNILPPEGTVQAAFTDVNAAIQDMNRSINEGREEINREIPRARGEAEEIVEIARGYAAERVNRAYGDVARYNAVLAEYLRAPEVTRARLYYETMEEVFENAEDLHLIDRNLNSILPMLSIGGGNR